MWLDPRARYCTDGAQWCRCGGDGFLSKKQEICAAATGRSFKRAAPRFCDGDGLFVNPEASFVNQLIQHAALDLLQFHGEESPEFCRQFSRPYIKAFRVGAPRQETAQALLSLCRQYDDAKGWLFDSYTPEYGGSGVAFDENILAELNQLRVETDAPIILAGGLTIENVRAKVQHLHPFALDVSSGIELAPGIKCPTKIAAFVRAITP